MTLYYHNIGGYDVKIRTIISHNRSHNYFSSMEVSAIAQYSASVIVWAKAS